MLHTLTWVDTTIKKRSERDMDKNEWGGGKEKARTAIVDVLTVLQTQNLEPNRTNLSFTLQMPESAKNWVGEVGESETRHGKIWFALRKIMASPRLLQIVYLSLLYVYSSELKWTQKIIIVKTAPKLNLSHLLLNKRFGTSTNHKLGRTVCNFANFGRTNMIQVGIPLVSLFLIVSLLWIFLQVSFWWRCV